MPAPTGTGYPSTLDTGTSIGSAVSSGQVIASAYADTSSSAILAIEETLGTNPQGSDASVGAALTARARKTDVQNQALTYADDSGTANAYAVALSPALTAYAEGQAVVFKAVHANTGASTVNVNGLGAKTLVKNGSSPLAAGDINAGQIYTAIFDGTNFQLANSLSSPVVVAEGGTGATTASGARSNLSAAESGANSDITSLSGLTSALSVGQGGTGATTATAARSSLSAAESGSNSDITSLSALTTALSVGQGGTGATTATAARSSLSAAESGSNSDITSLSALTTALSVGQGGTGATSAASARSSLSAAESGANSDITSLSGLTTALSVGQGGTGSSTAAGARTNLSVPALSDIQNQAATYAADTGTANAYAIALTPTVTAYAAGQLFSFKAAHSCTGASTLAVNGLAAQNIYKSATFPLASGDIVANQIVTVVYDGTQFQLVGAAVSGTGGVTEDEVYDITSARGVPGALLVPLTYASTSGANDIYTASSTYLSGLGAAPLDGQLVLFSFTNAMSTTQTVLVQWFDGSQAPLWDIYQGGMASGSVNTWFVAEYSALPGGSSPAWLAQFPSAPYAGFGSSANDIQFAVNTPGTLAGPILSGGGPTWDGTTMVAANLATTGSFRLNNVNPQSANYTITITDSFVPVTTGSSTITITLPTPSSTYQGQVVIVTKADLGAGTVAFSGTLGTATSLTSQGSLTTFICDGSGWYQK